MLRIHFSNRFGSGPVTLGPVTVGVVASGPTVVGGSLRPVTFNGSPTVTIPAGAEALSDPVSLSFSAFQDLAISVSVPGIVTSPTEHFTTRQTSYLSPAGSGDHSGDSDGAAFTQQTTSTASVGWYFLDGLDVQAPESVGAVVAFGDSITDGFQGTLTPLNENLSTINTNGRYPDDLQRRLIAAHVPLSVLNAGISGNRVLQNGEIPMFGPAGISRFGLDALAQGGVTDVIVLEGINDIGQTTGITAQQLIQGYENLIAQAHDAGLKIQLGTLTPSGGVIVPQYGDAAANQLRQQVNAWIRSQKLSDGVIDFDAAVRDPSDPSRIYPPYDGGDHLHFDLAGYQAMANAVNLGLLQRASCTSARPLPRLELAVRPHRLTVGTRTRLHLRVTDEIDGRSAPLRGALVQIDGHRVRTGPKGSATITLRFTRSGPVRAHATKTGYRAATATIDVVPAAVNFTG